MSVSELEQIPAVLLSRGEQPIATLDALFHLAVIWRSVLGGKKNPEIVLPADEGAFSSAKRECSGVSTRGAHLWCENGGTIDYGYTEKPDGRPGAADGTA